MTPCFQNNNSIQQDFFVNIFNILFKNNLRHCEHIEKITCKSLKEQNTKLKYKIGRNKSKVF